MSASTTIQLAGKQVGRIGYGLMHLTWYVPKLPSDEESFAAMKAAADAGATAWSTATFYGHAPDYTANLALIGRFFKKYPEYSDKVVLVVKGFLKPNSDTYDIEYSRAELKKANELVGRTIDIYSPARLSPTIPVEDIFQGFKTLKEEGLFKEVGGSEMNRASLERAQKIVPISVIEVEVALWSYESDVRAVIDWSRANQVPVFAYSPLGRGFLTRKWKSPEDIPDGWFQKDLPRFQGEAFYENLKLVDKLDELAAKKGVTSAQLALAWVKGLNDYMIPIPGSSDPARVKSNTEAAKLSLTDEDKAEFDQILARMPATGGRYMADHSKVLML